MEEPSFSSMMMAPSRTTNNSSEAGCKCQRYFPWKTERRRQLSLTRLSTWLRYSSVTAAASRGRSITCRLGYFTGSLLYPAAVGASLIGDSAGCEKVGLHQSVVDRKSVV